MCNFDAQDSQAFSELTAAEKLPMMSSLLDGFPAEGVAVEKEKPQSPAGNWEGRGGCVGVGGVSGQIATGVAIAKKITAGTWGVDTGDVHETLTVAHGLVTRAVRQVHVVVQALEATRRQQRAQVTRGVWRVEKLASSADTSQPSSGTNQVGQEDWKRRLAHELSRIGGGSMNHVGISLLAAAIASSSGEDLLSSLNAHSPIQEVVGGAALVLMRCGRLAHMHRCYSMAVALSHSLEGAQEIISEGMRKPTQMPTTASDCTSSKHVTEKSIIDESAEVEAELVQGGNQLAAALTSKRYGLAMPAGESNCRKIELASGDGVEVHVEPRLLRFEFTNSLLLRGPQVRLVREFMDAIGCDGQQQQTGPRAQVQQLLMGAGKTTVVAPLLALLLATPKSLVMQVVPHQLLHFSQQVFRSRFCSPFCARPVHRLHMSRHSTISRAFFLKVRRCREQRGVLVSNQSALKAFMLKVCELAHLLEESFALSAERIAAKASNNSEQRVVATGVRSMRAALARAMRAVGLRRWAQDENEEAALERVRGELRLQARRGVRVMKILRSACLLLDEVDMLLHPLRSELNWLVVDRTFVIKEPYLTLCLNQASCCQELWIFLLWHHPCGK